MLATGRGSIAHIHYTGDEAAGEIKKLLDNVVSTFPGFNLASAYATVG